MIVELSREILSIRAIDIRRIIEGLNEFSNVVLTLKEWEKVFGFDFFRWPAIFEIIGFGSLEEESKDFTQRDQR